MGVNSEGTVPADNRILTLYLVADTYGTPTYTRFEPFFLFLRSWTETPFLLLCSIRLYIDSTILFLIVSPSACSA